MFHFNTSLNFEQPLRVCLNLLAQVQSQQSEIIPDGLSHILDNVLYVTCVRMVFIDLVLGRWSLAGTRALQISCQQMSRCNISGWQNLLHDVSDLLQW